MFLEIITPEKKIFEGKINRIRLPGSKGSFEILKSHAPIVSTLERGEIRVIDDKNKVHTWKVNSGIVENKADKIIVLLDLI
jgi:F-type H+-transporting ATPase subunit epsilon